MLERDIGHFLSWARENGAFLDSRIEFQYSKQKGYSALIHDFLSGEELIKVPKQMVIGPHLKEQYLPGINYAHSDSYFTNNEMTILLISKLAFDTSLNDNRFKQYFEIVPKDFNIPYFWNSNEIDLVNGTDLELIFKTNFSKLVTEWHELMEQLIQDSLEEKFKQQILQDMKFYDDNIAGISLNYHGELYEYLNCENESWTSFRNYLWSYSILTSRGLPYILLKNEITRDDIQKAILVPIIDLLNHKNDYKVKWNGLKESKGSHVSFQSFEEGDKFGELYNNYGNKSNLQLLLGYGFVSENNKYDETSISLKVDSQELIKEALRYKILMNQNNDNNADIRYLKDGINFKITADEDLPSNLVNFFAILRQMKFERHVGISLRMQLNGTAHLKQVIEGKILLLKRNFVLGPQVKSGVHEVVKVYRNEQRKLFQNTLESLLKYEKTLLADNKAHLLSLKTILKNDVSFKSSLIKIFKVSSYEEILKKKIVNDVVLLWIVTLSKEKVSLRNPYFNTLIRNQINYIYSQIEEVSEAIDVNDEDVDEYKPKVSTYISDILQIWPDMFKNKIHFIRRYVIADTVFDRLSYSRPTNGELFIVQKVEAFA